MNRHFSPSSSIPGFIYGLQAVSWKTGEVLEPGMTKIGMTQRSVAERVAEMQSSLGAGGVHKLAVVFAVEVDDLRIERAVHRVLKARGRHLAVGSASEWFLISPEEAEVLVRDFAEGRRDADEVLRQAAPAPAPRRAGGGRAKELKITPARLAALETVRKTAEAGGSPSDIPGGRWGAAATALAVQEAVSKDAALVLLREMFLGRASEVA